MAIQIFVVKVWLTFIVNKLPVLNQKQTWWQQRKVRFHSI